MFKKGFTLIELLIVIAVLGILAVAVLSAINPVEQINRSRDTGSTSDAEQLISAIDRYYANQQINPWQNDTTDPIDVAWTKINTTAVLSDMLAKLQEGTLGTIVGTGEVKDAYVTRITQPTYNHLFLYKKDDTSSTYVCFKPFAKAGVSDATERCSAAPPDYPPSACSNTTDCGTGGACICLP